MEAATEAFRLLSLELPDPNQELLERNLGEPLTPFEHSPKLPPALRHMIWRFTFPRPRMINLTPSQFSRLWNAWDPRKREAPFPITLYINHESRCITLQRYRILFQRHACPLPGSVVDSILSVLFPIIRFTILLLVQGKEDYTTTII
jgi:hypothetical protein